MPLDTLFSLFLRYATYLAGILLLFLVWKSILLVGGTEIAVMDPR